MEKTFDPIFLASKSEEKTLALKTAISSPTRTELVMFDHFRIVTDPDAKEISIFPISEEDDWSVKIFPSAIPYDNILDILDGKTEQLELKRRFL